MELEILEALALADDRRAALAQLLPGSEDHDYYRALHAQHRGALDEADGVLAAWPERHGATPRYERLRLRQLLYRVAGAPQAALQIAPAQAADQLRDRLGVNHWHEAQAEAHDPSRPTRLPDGAFDPVALLRYAVEHDANLSQVTEEGVSELVEWTLEPSRRRALLSRLSHTAQPQVVELVAEELGQRGSSGFGGLAIHRELTLDQLHALAEHRPELRAQGNWVGAVITRMRPPATIDLELDRDARAAYLDALWQFVGELPPANNSLKAHVLWHLLDTVRRRGEPIAPELARTYLALPRAAGYLARSWIDRVRREEVAQLGADFRGVTGLGPAGAAGPSPDEQLVRELIHQQRDDAERYAAWIDRDWLEAEIATARLIYGDRDAERATLVLGPARAAALRDRVELAWCVHNPTRFAADEPIALDADVKNIGELVIKVFRIDPLAYFQHHRREVDTALDLDGLAASDEQLIAIKKPAIRRVRRRIELASCARPGTYVIDLIGNGMSSRAVVHKGRLRYVMRTGAAGHVITILDEAGQPRPDARAWIGEREYTANERGAVIVPFSTNPARVAMLLTAGDIATVAHIELSAESAELSLALALDRQSLAAGRTARAIARIALVIGGAPASLALLKQPRCEISLTDREGVVTTKSQPLELADDRALELFWPLGEDTAEVAVTVRGRIEIRSEQTEREVTCGRECQVATMYAGPSTEALYLAQTDAGWVVSALGVTGEPRAHRPVTVGILHRWTQLQHNAELATDARGRVELGRLSGARRLTATLGSLTQTWSLDEPIAAAVPIHAASGSDVVIAIPAGRDAADVVRRASLVELRAGAPARHPEVTFEPLAGAIAIRGLPPGEYQLRAHGVPRTAITVAAPVAQLAGWAITPSELVQVPRLPPVIAALAAERGELAIRLHGAAAETRVHVIATRFVPALVDELGRTPRPAPRKRADRAIGVRYVSGRELGDEYRYILERRTAPRFPGLLIDRPSLLLNPWARRTTSTDVATARPGGAFAAAPQAAAPMMRGFGGRTEDAPVIGPDDSFAGYDFLPTEPAVLANLVPDETGAIRVAISALGTATSVTIIVDDPAGMTLGRLALGEPRASADAPRDLRLGLALAPDRHATQHKTIAPLRPGEQLVIDDIATAKLHLIDSVERGHTYLLALREDPLLLEFAFVTRWHALADAERRELYSKYACHELHLFLYFKDRAFFDEVIRPYLANKRTKTFVDHWLLDAELSAYLAPVRLARLNAVERALLAQRLAHDPAVVKLLADEVAIQPPSPERDARLIDALIGGATLDGDDGVSEAMATAVGGYFGGGGEDFRAELAEESAVAPPAPAQPPPMPRRPASSAPKLGKSAGAGRAMAGVAPMSLSEAERNEDLANREAAAPMFRAIDKTQEWAETNWWRMTPAQSGASLIAPNRLWRDLAVHTGGGFLSPWLGLATGSFAEAMCALAVTALPFVAPAHAIVTDGPRLSITAAGNTLAGSSQLVDGELARAGAPLVVGMSYVRADDRYDWSSGEQVDKYVDGPLATGVVYTCRVVLANPTSSRQRVAALIQIPRGSIAVAGARPTHTVDVVLQPYGTHGHEYSFYFPAPGTWTHFPVHVSRAEQIVAAAPGRTLEVVAGGSVLDPRSWPHVSQRSAVADVVAYLGAANLAATDLSRVAWRMRDRAAFTAIIGALEARRAFDATLWGYALMHRDAPRIRSWLATLADSLIGSAGPVLDMLALDAEDTHHYEHLELAPLVNARAHRLGNKLRILNDGLAAQYTKFLELVAHRAQPTSGDRLAAAHYLLAQGRVPEALAELGRIELGAVADRLQYDYLAAYAACLIGDLGPARTTAVHWRDHPVDRWRHRFAALAAMLDQVDGAPGSVVDAKSREQQLAELSARQPTFELAVDRDGVVLRTANVGAVELRFFEMDIELLFSRQPFVQSDVSRFSFIEPGHRERLAEPPPTHRIAWPERLRGKNIVVEAVGAGMRSAKVHYANDLALNLAHQYGQIRVQRASDLGALAATYVKVYARKHDGAVTFYKDGYTDLRGWFDYATLSTNELDSVARFAILVCSDHSGAAILEAGTPAR